jgi:cytochrome P450
MEPSEANASDNDWYNDPLPGVEFAAALHELRAAAPVVRVTGVGGQLKAFYIVEHAALAEAFKDAERFPPGLAYQIISKPFIGNTFMSMDEAGNRRWRPPMTPFFRRSTVEARDDDRIARYAHKLVDGLAKESEVDFCLAFTRVFSFAVICELLGLPLGRESEFYQLSMDLMFGGRDLAASQAADAKFCAYAQPTIAERRLEPKDDVISAWCQVEIEGRRLTDDEILAHMRLFFTAGATTTSDGLGNLVHALLTHPEVWQVCREDPAQCAKAVEELLRFNPPVAAQPRFSRADATVEYRGCEISPNHPMLFGIAAANRDPEVFNDPDRFDIERDHKKILTFGPGLRTCPGMHLARKNLRVALEVLTERVPDLTFASEADEIASRPQGVLLRGPATLRVKLGAVR